MVTRHRKNKKVLVVPNMWATDTRQAAGLFQERHMDSSTRLLQPALDFAAHILRRIKYDFSLHGYRFHKSFRHYVFSQIMRAESQILAFGVPRNNLKLRKDFDTRESIEKR
jgi:hypothetical protein